MFRIMAGFALDVFTLDSAREAWRSGNAASVIATPIENISLGASLEAACWAATGDAEATKVVERWAMSFPIVAEGLAALTGASSFPSAGDHDAPPHEVRACPSRSELKDASVGVEWNYFLDRFRRSLVKRLKLNTSTAWALSAALEEMADNVSEHSGLGDASKGIIAYEVNDEFFAFAVGDLGRGIRASLNENPQHDAISTDESALLAAVTCGASRRPGPNGEGFALLLRALADLEGSWAFRSGSARLTLEGRGAGARIVRPSNCLDMLGFQLSVEAQPKKSTW